MGFLGDIWNGVSGFLDPISDEDKTTEWSSVPVDNDGDGVTDDPSAPLYWQEEGPNGNSSRGPEWVENAGTTHSKLRNDDPNFRDKQIDGTGADDFRQVMGSGDPRNLMWGRDPGAADAAVANALQTGADAQAYGIASNSANRNVAGQLQNRAAPTGNWNAQNGALAGASGLGNQLAGLEATQGPSAAQAQLQAGTNQAMGSQIALARSGRGFGGSAGASGLAQGQLASLGAANANASASLRAQEDAAWRGRQAANLGNAAGIEMGIGSQYGDQGRSDLGAAVTARGQNDSAALGWAGLGNDAWKAGVGANLGGQGVGAGIRGAELSAGQNTEDLALRHWAAQNGYNLAEGQRQDANDAAALNFAATTTAGLFDAFGGDDDTKSSDVRNKTAIAPSKQAGTDFARGLDFDGTIFRPRQMGGYDPKPVQDQGMTPMQAQYMGDGKPSGGDGGEGQSGAPAAASTFAPEARPDTSKPFDMDSLDASALDAVRQSPASFYDYKNPDAPGADAGRHYGPMAQDLAKTPAGASAVVKQPDGSLGVDTGRLALVHNGAISEQQKQLDELQSQLDAFAKKPASVDANTVYGGRR